MNNNNVIKIDDKSIINIEVNYEQAKKWAEDYASKYNGVVVMEDQLPTVVKETAELRKISKEIDDKRKEIENDHKLQIQGVVSKLKELKGIFDKAAEGLATQTQEFEKKYREERKENVKNMVDEFIANNSLIEYRDRFDVRDSWTNKSTTKKSIIADFIQIKEEIIAQKKAEEEASRLREEKIASVQAYYNKVLPTVKGKMTLSPESKYLSVVDSWSMQKIFEEIDREAERVNLINAEAKSKEEEKTILEDKSVIQEKERVSFAPPMVKREEKTKITNEAPEKTYTVSIEMKVKASNVSKLKNIFDNLVKPICEEFKNV